MNRCPWCGHDTDDRAAFMIAAGVYGVSAAIVIWTIAHLARIFL